MDVTDIIEGKCGSRIIVGPVKYLVKYDANGGSVSNLTTTNGGTINLYAVWKINYRCTTGTLTVDSNKGSSLGGYICVVSGEYWEDSYSCNCDTCSGCDRKDLSNKNCKR